MTTLLSRLRHLRPAALRALDDGLVALHRHDAALSPADVAELRQQAGACLREVSPLSELLERHDRLLGLAGLGLVLCAIGGGMYGFSGVTSAPGLSQAALNALLAAAGSVFTLVSMSVMTQRVECAVSLASDVLAALPERRGA